MLWTQRLTFHVTQFFYRHDYALVFIIAAVPELGSRCDPSIARLLFIIIITSSDQFHINSTIYIDSYNQCIFRIYQHTHILPTIRPKIELSLASRLWILSSLHISYHSHSYQYYLINFIPFKKPIRHQKVYPTTLQTHHPRTIGCQVSTCLILSQNLISALIKWRCQISLHLFLQWKIPSKSVIFFLPIHNQQNLCRYLFNKYECTRIIDLIWQLKIYTNIIPRTFSHSFISVVPQTSSRRFSS